MAISSEQIPAPVRGSGPLALLRANKAFRWLWLSRCISEIGNSLGLLALVLFTARQTGQGWTVALLMLVGDFAPTLFSPLTGTLSDRVERKRLLLLCELGQGAIIGLIAWLALPLPFFLGLVGLRTVTGQLFGAASRSILPGLVEPADLETANAALGIGTTGLELVGPLLAALLLPFLDVSDLLLIDAATFLLSAMLLLNLPVLPSGRRDPSQKGAFLTEAKEGLGYIWHSPVIRWLTLGFTGFVAFTAIDDVALVFLAKDALGAGDSGTSLAYVGAGIGLLIGFAFLFWLKGRIALPLLLLVGYTLGSGGNLLTGLAGTIPVVMLTQAIRGVGNSQIDLANNTLVQRLVAPAMLGRVFGNLYGAIGLAAGISYVAGGLLVNLIGPRLVFILAGAGGLVVTLMLALSLPAALRQAGIGTVTAEVETLPD